MLQSWRLRAATLVATAALLGLAGISPLATAQVNGFSKNQLLTLPLTAGNLPVSFIVRGLEPSNRTDNQGTIYVSSIRGVPGGVDAHRWSPVIDPPPNADGTLPFHYLGQPDNCGIFANGCDNIGIALGGGDVDIAVNSALLPAVPNLALVSLTLAPGITSTHSTNRGKTFTQPNPVAALIPGDDRQWIDAAGQGTVYLSYHDVATFNIEVQRSTDGGFTYAPGAGEAIDATTFPAAGNTTPTATANILGNIAIDKTSCTSSSGNVYQIFVAPDSAIENANGKPMRSVYVGVSTDAKKMAPTFTFTDHKVFTGPTGSSNNNIFPSIAVDDFGYVYAVWSDNSNIFFSSSRDQGTAWSPAMVVNQGATVGKANVFPWVHADANGHVAVVWLGADRVGNSNDATVMAPCTSGSTTCMSNWAHWNVFVAESVNGNEDFDKPGVDAPVFVQRIVSDHVIHRGTVSTGGLGGSANRNLADYFQVSFDPQHRAIVASSDDHLVHPLCSSVTPGHCGANDPQTERLIRANFTRELQPFPGIVTKGVCGAEL
jgi:hypothetical protein